MAIVDGDNDAKINNTKSNVQKNLHVEDSLELLLYSLYHAFNAQSETPVIKITLLNPNNSRFSHITMQFDLFDYTVD